MVHRGARRIISLGVPAAAAMLLLWALAPRAGAGEPRVELFLPERSVTLPVVSSAGVPSVALKALAGAMGASVQDGAGGGVALSWEGRRIIFAPNRRQAVGPNGIVLLSAPARWRGGQWWVPLDGVALAARERFGADRVRWDPRTRRITVESPAPLVRAIRVGWHPDRLRVVLEAGRALPWSVKTGEAGHLLVSLPGATLSQDVARKDFREGPLRFIEPGQGPEGAEVLLALAGPANGARWFALENPFRIVVDLPRAGGVPRPAAVPPAPAEGNGTGPDPAAAQPSRPALRRGSSESRAPAAEPPPQGRSAAPPAAPATPADLRPGTVQALAPAIAPGLDRRDGRVPEAAERGPAPEPAPEAPPGPGRGALLTIVIDPGHGGKDTGALGPRGLKEKDVVLDIALRLRRLLVDRLGARVILTRSDDTFVPLEERTAIANKAQADFFISLHVNSASQVRATGVETYYLSREPSDGDARASATRENLALHLEGIGPREEEGLKAILWDMAQTLTLRESSALAEMLLEDLARALRKENRGVKHGPFVVLMTAGMPSALVEIGFISNPHQERRMQDEAYRQQIANSLAQGIGRFATRYQRRLGMQPARPGRS